MNSKSIACTWVPRQIVNGETHVRRQFAISQLHKSHLAWTTWNWMNGIDFSQNADYFWFYSQPIRLTKSQDAHMVVDNKACDSRFVVGSRFIELYYRSYANLSDVLQLEIRNAKMSDRVA